MECTDCSLYKGVNSNCTPTDGNLNSSLLLVGEANGADEDQTGKPFVGKSGRMLRQALRQANITDFAVTNICRCRPPKNRPPKPNEMEACFHYTLEDIERMPNLQVIVAIGNVALRAFTSQQGITKVSGEEWSWEHKDKHYRLMPLIHPSYVLQNITELDRFFDHVSRIPRMLENALVDESDLGEYTVIRNIFEWKKYISKLSNCKFFSYDLETNGLQPRDEGSVIKCIQFSEDFKKATVLPLNIWDLEEWDAIHLDLKNIFENKKIGKVGQNIKFDNLWMKTILKIDVKGVIGDTKLGEFLLIGKGSTGLKEMAWRYSRLGGYEKKLPMSPDKVDGEDLEILYRYGAIDADLTRRIYLAQRPKLKALPGVEHLYKTLMIPISDVLVRMEHAGIRIDVNRVKEADKEADDKIEELNYKMRNHPAVKELERSEEVEFNPNSPKQKVFILYKVMGLEIFKTTDKSEAPSTDQEVLERYAPTNDFCKLLLDYSIYNQMKNKYIKDLLTLERNGRVHTTIWLTESYSRTSSKNPNMQNLPKLDNDIFKLRNAVIPDDGYKLAEFDMSQHELRVNAEMAHDHIMLEALTGDIHRLTAAAVLGKKPEDVTPAERDRPGKTVNFGMIYGLTEYGLMRQTGCDKQTAQMWLYRFFEKYYMTKRAMEEQNAFVKKYGYVEALSGRRRYFPSWEEFDNKKLKEAVNFPIQATASDILLYGAIGVDHLLRGRKSFIILEIHDSLLINLHMDEFDLIEQIKGVMCNYFRQFMPFESELKVDCKLGDNWGELKEYK